MKQLIKQYFLLCLTLFLFQGMIAQEATTSLDQVKHIDVVYLKNGSEFRGQIIEYQPGEFLKIKILGGVEVEFQDHQIEKIVQEPVSIKAKGGPKSYNFSETGFYNFTYVSNFNASSGFGTHYVGLGLHTVTGYQINRLIGVGIGIGIENYEVSFPRSVAPLYLEARGYFTDKNISPYYSMNVGWGFPLKREFNGVNETEGGVFINPNIGVRLGAKKGVNFTADVGYKYQRATFISNF
ncbi:MAG: hypothetical protein AAF598_08400, partial [Bacteroidota bacterium]